MAGGTDMALLVTVVVVVECVFVRENVRGQVGLKVQAGNIVVDVLAKTVYEMLEMAAVVIVSAGDEQSGLMIN
jgi:hypothetical protein